MLTFDKAFRLRFWSKVDRSGDCWLWVAYRNTKGYGQVAFDGHLWLAHRIAFAMKHRRVPRLNVLHRCDVPACVRPAHLFEGTQADNIADCHAKGRHAFVGSRNWSAKLTEHQVRQIRNADWTGKTQREIARLYGVSQPTVSRILRATHWRSALC